MSSPSNCVHKTISFPSHGSNVPKVADDSREHTSPPLNLHADHGNLKIDAVVFHTGPDLYDMRVGGRQRRRNTAAASVKRAPSSVKAADPLWGEFTADAPKASRSSERINASKTDAMRSSRLATNRAQGGSAPGNSGATASGGSARQSAASSRKAANAAGGQKPQVAKDLPHHHDHSPDATPSPSPEPQLQELPFLPPGWRVANSESPSQSESADQYVGPNSRIWSWEALITHLGMALGHTASSSPAVSLPERTQQPSRSSIMPSSAHMLAWLQCLARDTGHPASSVLTPSSPAAAEVPKDATTSQLQAPRHVRKRKLGSEEQAASFQGEARYPAMPVITATGKASQAGFLRLRLARIQI